VDLLTPDLSQTKMRIAAVALLALLLLAAVANAAGIKEKPDKEAMKEKRRAEMRARHEKQNEQAFHLADSDKDNSVSKEEYKKYYRDKLSKMKTVSQQAIESSDKIRDDVFARLDTDGDGKLSATEFDVHARRGGSLDSENRRQGGPPETEEDRRRRRVPFSGAPEDRKADFEKADTDGSKTISSAEFSAYLFENAPDAHRPRSARENKNRRALTPEKQKIVDERAVKRKEKLAKRWETMFARYKLPRQKQHPGPSRITQPPHSTKLGTLKPAPRCMGCLLTCARFSGSTRIKTVRFPPMSWRHLRSASVVAGPKSAVDAASAPRCDRAYSCAITQAPRGRRDCAC